MKFLLKMLVVAGFVGVSVAPSAKADGVACNAPGVCVCQKWVDSSFQVMYWDGLRWVALTNLAPGLTNCIKTMKTDPNIKYICGY